MRWVNRALDPRLLRAPPPDRTKSGHDLRAVALTRWALRTGENKLTDDKRELVNQHRPHQPPHRPRVDAQRTTPRPLPLRAPPGVARQLLQALDHRRQTQPHPRLRRTRQTLAVYFDAILAAIELGISNALIEGINAKIRLINARGYGHHSAQTLTSMIYLCLGGLDPRRSPGRMRAIPVRGAVEYVAAR